MDSAEFPADLRTPGVARRFLRRVLAAQWPREPDDAVLLTSELVTNAVLHARTLLEVTVTVTGPTLRIEVGDDSMVPPRSRRPSAVATDGRGIALVEAIASRWGVEATPTGKCVWFELDSGDAGIGDGHAPGMQLDDRVSA